MKAAQLQKQNIKELTERVQKLETELKELKFEQRTGKDQNFVEAKKKKKEIARVLTVIRHKELFGDIQTESKE